MLLRPAIAGDENEVAGVHVRTWQAAYRGLLPDAYLDGLRPEAGAMRYTFGTADRGGRQTVVATDGGAVRGFATVGPSRDEDRPDSGELYALYVDPGSWSGGYGRALIREARALLRATGATHACLWVLVGNERAQRFYGIDGWRPDGERRLDEVRGVTVDELRYERRLP